MSEPTLADVRAAVFALPLPDLEELALGPVVSDDPDACRICDHFDDDIYGGSGRDEQELHAVLTLVDWHRFYGSPNRDGRGPEAYRRCELVYALAREAVVERHATLAFLDTFMLGEAFVADGRRVHPDDVVRDPDGTTAVDRHGRIFRPVEPDER